MKSHNAKILTGAVMITVFALSGCAGKNENQMIEIKKNSMDSEMMHDTEMQKVGGVMVEPMKPQMDAKKSGSEKLIRSIYAFFERSLFSSTS